jgi:hypothetical protein
VNPHLKREVQEVKHDAARGFSNHLGRDGLRRLDADVGGERGEYFQDRL